MPRSYRHISQLATLQAGQKKLPKNDVIQVFNHIREGGMPQVQGVDDELRQEYFNSYIDTYLMSDVTEAEELQILYDSANSLSDALPLCRSKLITPLLPSPQILHRTQRKNG